MKIKIDFVKRPEELRSPSALTVLLPGAETDGSDYLESCRRAVRTSGAPLVTAPFVQGGQRVVACLTPEGEHFQPMCFLSPAEEALFSPGSDVYCVDMPFGKMALCCGLDLFQPQYARLAALKGCVLMAASCPEDGPYYPTESAAWAAVQANCLPVALARREGGTLILPCDMTGDLRGLGRDSFDTDELPRAYEAFPVFDSFNAAFFERYGEVLMG